MYPSNPQILELQPYDWVSNDRDNAFSIRIWCHNRDSERVLLRIENYQPFCRVELPNIIGGSFFEWTPYRRQVFKKWLCHVLREHAPTRFEDKNMRKLYWYKPDTTYPFLVCYFQTEEAMRHCTRLLDKKEYYIGEIGRIITRVWEQSITTIHRLITDMNLGYGQWFTAEAFPVPELDRISTCRYEFTASYRSLRSLSPEETKDWSTSPLVAAIDIECYSHRHRAMPNKNLVEDVVFQVSYITQRLGDPFTRKKYLLVLGDCADIPGAEILRFADELSLINGLCDLIKETDPTILTGYNIFKFDFPYMDARMKLYLRDWKSCGLIKDQKTFINVRKWKSSAYGFMTLATLEAEGRLCIDMYTIIKRDHKLDRYTLDFVSKHFLGRGKHDVTARQMFEIFKESREAIAQGDFERITRSKAALARVGAYCLEDSCLCIDLMEALSTWIMLTELSTIVQVTMMEIFTRGQQIRVQNQVYSFVYRENYVIDERPGSKDSFKGAHVFDPNPGKYHNILIFDFASLYPSIIRAYNICYSTLVPDELNIPDYKCHVIQWQDEDRPHRYRFIKQEYFHGFLPRMCEHLVAARKATRSQIGPHNNDVTNIVLNQRQLGLKISANSIYGSLGVREGRLPLPEGSRCITAMGRRLTLMAAEHVEKTGQGKVVYGDSVAGNTPILIRRNGKIRWVRIQSLCPRSVEKTRYTLKGYEVWSDLGWTQIKRVICHWVNKRMFRVLTYTGCVDVTEDHSLLLSNGSKISPTQIPNKLLHCVLPKLSERDTLNLRKGKGKLLLAKVFHSLRNASYDVCINLDSDRIRLDLRTVEDPIAVQSIVELPFYNGYVYDLETENHHFSAGIGEIVVHNTDSIMVDAGIKDPHECIIKGKALSKEISALYPPPLVLEFERALSVVLFIKKKKYAGVPLAIIKTKPEDLIEEASFTEGNENPELKLWKITQEKGTVRYLGIPKDVSVKGRKIIAGMPLSEGGAPDEKELMKKGIILARRDNCLWVRKGYKKILLNVLFNKSLQDTLNLVDSEILKMMTRQVPFANLMVTGEIGSNYKPNSTYFVKLFADELRRQGTPIQAGERFDYIFVRCKEEWRNSKQGYKMRLPEMYWANCYEEPIDTLHYVKKFQNPVEQIVYLGYKDEIDEIERRCAPEIKRRGRIYTYIKHDYISTWIKLIRYKEEPMRCIKLTKPHFPSQEPYFSDSYPTIGLD